jgi:hypothetical protein
MMERGSMNPGEPMDSDDLAAATERLETALERIATLSARARADHPPAAGPPAAGPPAAGDVDKAAIVARLDTTIASLKAAIGDI